MKNLLRLAFFLFLAGYLLTLVILRAWGADRLVTPTDNLEALLRSASPGDVFVLADGQYSGAYISTRPGTVAAPIVVRAANPGKAIIGPATGREDCLRLYKCSWWRLEGLVTERALAAGVRLGYSDHVTLLNHVSRLNYGQGMLTGGSNYGTVRGGRFILTTTQHGIYVSAPANGWVIDGVECSGSGGAGIQMNAQGVPGFVRDAKILNCSITNNGQKHVAAAVNLIGVVNSVIAGNTLHDNKAGGIAMIGDGEGPSTGNTIYSNVVTFRAGEGRTCMTFSMGGTNSVTGNRMWTGRATTAAIECKLPSVVVEAGNVVLPAAKPVVEVPVGDPVESGT